MNILITGTTSGIGRYLAEKLSVKYKTFGISRSNSIIKNKNYTHLKVNLFNIKKIEKILDNLNKKKIYFDVFISNTGYVNNKLIYRQKTETIIKNNMLNLTIPTILTKNIIPSMVNNNFGKIIFISSVACSLKSIGTSIYTASKVGLECFSEIINKELKSSKIKSHVIRVSYIETNSTKKIPKIEINKLLKNLKTKNYTKLGKVLRTIDHIIENKENRKLVKDKIFKL
jgi:short-subunit dehydrogenase